MPIKPENKDLYPKDWKQISARIRFERAENRCEVCDIDNYALVHRFGKGIHDWQYWPEGMESEAWSLDGKKSTKIILTVAHLDHNPQNNSDDNLKAMCQQCHNRYDRSHRTQTIRNSKLKNQIPLNLTP